MTSRAPHTSHTPPMPTPSMPLTPPPMLIRCGCDLVAISRLENPRDRLLNRLFDQEELDLCGGRPASLAAFYAGKEAFAKALGCGLMAAKGLAFKDIAIRKTDQGAPYYVWGDRVEDLLAQLSFPQDSADPRLRDGPRYRLGSASLSLSHEAGLAMAFAVLCLEPLIATDATRGGRKDG